MEPPCGPTRCRWPRGGRRDWRRAPPPASTRPATWPILRCRWPRGGRKTHIGHSPQPQTKDHPDSPRLKPTIPRSALANPLVVPLPSRPSVFPHVCFRPGFLPTSLGEQAIPFHMILSPKRRPRSFGSYFTATFGLGALRHPMRGQLPRDARRAPQTARDCGFAKAIGSA